MSAPARNAFCALALFGVVTSGVAAETAISPLKTAGHVRDARGTEVARLNTEGLPPKACLEALAAVALAVRPVAGDLRLEGACVDTSKPTALNDCLFNASLTGRQSGCDPNVSYRPVELYAGIEPRCTVTVADRRDPDLASLAYRRPGQPLTPPQRTALESFFNRRCTITVGVSAPRSPANPVRLEAAAP